MRIEFEKFCNYVLGKWFQSQDKHLLIGKFKSDGSDMIHTEEFMAYKLQGGDALETYESYIKYFNHTIQDKYEKPRTAVSAKWGKK